MAVEEEVRTVREAVGVFNRPEELQGAIDELLSSGFYRAELSLLASAHAVEAKLDHRYEKVSSLADDPTVPREAYVSTEAIGGAEGGLIGGLMYVGAAAAAGAIVISGGTLATAIGATALAGGAGGLDRLDPGQMGRRSSFSLSARAGGSWRLAAMGAYMGCRGRRTRRPNSQKALGNAVPTFTHCLRIISRERACPLAAHLDLDILHLAQQNDLRRSRFFNAIMPMDLTIRGIDHRCVA